MGLEEFGEIGMGIRRGWSVRSDRVGRYSCAEGERIGILSIFGGSRSSGFVDFFLIWELMFL